VVYWRMQLHPGRRASQNAVQYTVESLAAHVIGLELDTDVGDMRLVTKAEMDTSDRHCHAFASDMDSGDHVLIFAHYFPFALCRVAGEYKYVPNPELGSWFRHSRQVDDVWFYGDYIKDPHKWERIKMRPAIQRVHVRTQPAYVLIEKWLAARA
jgi:hypothetical protein